MEGPHFDVATLLSYVDDRCRPLPGYSIRVSARLKPHPEWGKAKRALLHNWTIWISPAMAQLIAPVKPDDRTRAAKMRADEEMQRSLKSIEVVPVYGAIEDAWREAF